MLVFGGSLGARSINLAAVEALSGAPFHVLHVSGRRDHAELDARGLPADYDLREYLDLGDFADALAAADLVVRALGRVGVRDRRPRAAGDARPLPARLGGPPERERALDGRAGAAVVIPDAELPRHACGSEVAALLADRERLPAMVRGRGALARPDAARDVAQELLDAAAGNTAGQSSGSSA